MNALTVKNLRKSYGHCEVLKNISLNVIKGEIFAILGVNGAGKTTLLECVEGLRKYDSGTIEVSKSMGVQLQSSTLPKNIKVLEAVTLYSMWNSRKVDTDMMSRLGILEIKNKKYSELSGGQKRRLHLVLALIADPEIIFLDEPTAALDVESRSNLHKEILEMKKQGKTIILASHDMAEVEMLADKVALISGGEIVFCGTVKELISKKQASTKVKLKIGSSNDWKIFDDVTDYEIEKPTLEESFLSMVKGAKK